MHVKRLMQPVWQAASDANFPLASGMHFFSGVPVHVYLLLDGDGDGGEGGDGGFGEGGGAGGDGGDGPPHFAWHAASDVNCPSAACTQCVAGEPVHVKRLMQPVWQAASDANFPLASGMHFFSGVPVHVYLPLDGDGDGGEGPRQLALQAFSDANLPLAACTQNLSGEPVHVKCVTQLALHAPMEPNFPFASRTHCIYGVPVQVYLPEPGGDGGCVPLLQRQMSDSGQL
eukprot:COSAG01_NODE_170_length_23136_cov_24.853931_20_plen_229_part_00